MEKWGGLFLGDTWALGRLPLEEGQKETDKPFLQGLALRVQPVPVIAAKRPLD